MLRALYTAASGMIAQQTNMDTVSHNLANVNTTGFKKGRAEFQDLLYTQLQSPVRADAAVGISVGQGARLSSVQRIFGGGSLQVTGEDYDVAIQGEGFFRVRRADGSIAYTRDGSFRLDGQRRLVTAGGDLLLGANGQPIIIPSEAADVEITAEGTVRYADNAKAADPNQAAGATVVIGRIALAVFPNPAGLDAMGDNLWAATANSGQAQNMNPGDKGAGRLAQGSLEGSNVQAVEEMVNLIVAQRAYEINSKVAQSADEMMSMTNNLRRG